MRPRCGVASLKPDFKTLGGTQSLIDALLSGQMNFGVTGVPGLATLWDKTAGTPMKCARSPPCSRCRSCW